MQSMLSTPTTAIQSNQKDEGNSRFRYDPRMASTMQRMVKYSWVLKLRDVK